MRWLVMILIFFALYTLGSHIFELYYERIKSLILKRGYTVIAVIAVFAVLLTGMPFLALITGLSFYLIPVIVRKKREIEEEKLFEIQFSSAMDSIASSMRAGMGLYSGIERVAESFAPPLGPVFREIILEVKKGNELVKAIKSVSERYPNQELIIFAESIDTIVRYGGSIARFLDVLSESVKNRMRIKDKARVLATQQRFQAILMFFLPFFILFAVSLIDFQLVKAFLSSKSGFLLSVAGLSLQLLGGYILWKMVGGEV
jgi:tight adherence protein B